MTTITQPLRDEHRELMPHIEHLRLAAEAVGELERDALAHRIDAVHAFLAGQLIPHAEAEDQALYAAVGRIMGAPEATATMSRDHVEVARLTTELGTLRAKLASGALTTALQKDLRRVLYGLYALVKVHFAKEEEIYLPLLDAQLTDAEAQQLFARMRGHAHGEPVQR